MTVAMAFDYFAREKVDVAVVEVGLGGRLDSTNIISPELSIITNIGLDHTDLLGDTLEKIAIEKAGIVKPNVPVVLGESNPAYRHEIEEAALKKEEDRLSKEHLAEIQKELAELRDTFAGMAGRFSAELWSVSAISCSPHSFANPAIDAGVISFSAQGDRHECRCKS